jgi:hypothetical protein
MVECNKERNVALEELGRILGKIVKWLKNSILKVNSSKTELFIFHCDKSTESSSRIDDVEVTSTNEINVFGLTFDSRLHFGMQISHTINSSNGSLPAIRIIKKFFTTPEIIQLLTSN